MIVIENLSMEQGEFAIFKVNIELPDHAYATIMGPTGCGKTTLIEGICGLRPLTSGRIIIDDEDITDLDPADRKIAYVPQDGAMFPNMNVAEHLGFALRVRHVPATKISHRVGQLASELGISHLLNRMPQGLSGGERQRVSLGRALAHPPRLLLLDEPLAALDEDHREGLISVLADIHLRHDLTVMHITHNRQEAEQLATYCLEFKDGSVSEVCKTMCDPPSLPPKE